MLNPVSGRCTQYFGDVLRQIQFQTEPEGYFLDAGQEPPKRGIFRFPTKAARISNHKLKQGQGLPLGSGKFRGSTEFASEHKRTAQTIFSALPERRNGARKRAADVQRKKGREPEIIPAARPTGLTNET